MGGFECSESIRKRKIREKNPFFQIILHKVLIISADVKANAMNNKKLEDPAVVSSKFLSEVPSNVKT